MNLPITNADDVCRVIEVSFNQGSRKDFFRNGTLQHFEKGELITVEGVAGFDVGDVSLTGEIVRLQMKKKGVDEFNPDMKKVLRRATDRDLDIQKQNKAREKNAVIRSRAIARQLNLNMKISQVEIQADGKKATFFYIADDRVDFRELIKVYAGEFRVKVEMKQIGARQEAGKVGGIGSCGRELCCSTWLTDFKSVNTNAARYQNLSINQTKLSGQCGRLKCCLNYELDTYLDALQNFPDDCDMIEVAKSRAFLVKKDIFRNLMWYTMPDSNKQYPLTIERVQKIKALNRQGIRPEELEPVEVVSRKPVEIEPTYVDVVGQISLKSLEKTSRKRRDNERGQQDPGRQQRQGREQDRQGGNEQRSRGSQSGQQNKPQQRPPQNRNGQGQQRPASNLDGQAQRPQGQGRDGQNQQRGQQQNRSGQPRQNQPNRQQQKPPQNRGNQPNKPNQKPESKEEKN